MNAHLRKLTFKTKSKVHIAFALMCACVCAFALLCFAPYSAWADVPSNTLYSQNVSLGIYLTDTTTSTDADGNTVTNNSPSVVVTPEPLVGATTDLGIYLTDSSKDGDFENKPAITGTGDNRKAEIATELGIYLTDTSTNSEGNTNTNTSAAPTTDTNIGITTDLGIYLTDTSTKTDDAGNNVTNTNATPVVPQASVSTDLGIYLTDTSTDSAGNTNTQTAPAPDATSKVEAATDLGIYLTNTDNTANSNGANVGVGTTLSMKIKDAREKTVYTFSLNNKEGASVPDSVSATWADEDKTQADIERYVAASKGEALPAIDEPAVIEDAYHVLNGWDVVHNGAPAGFIPKGEVNTLEVEAGTYQFVANWAGPGYVDFDAAEGTISGSYEGATLDGSKLVYAGKPNATFNARTNFPTVTAPDENKVLSHWEKPDGSVASVSDITKVAYSTSHTTFKAVWKEKQSATIKFDALGAIPNAAFNDVVGKVGDAISAIFPTSATPEKQGYTFNGWYEALLNDDGTPQKDANGNYVLVDGDTAITAFPAEFEKPLTIYVAKWQANASTVVLHANGGTFGAVSEGTLSDDNQTLTLNGKHDDAFTCSAEPTRTNYKFTGWYTDPECSLAAALPTTFVQGDTHLYAGWAIDNANLVNINFDLNYEDKPAGTYKTYTGLPGDSTTDFVFPNNKDDITRPGNNTTRFEFGGWNTQADGSGAYVTALPSVFPEQSVTYYAQWLVKESSVGGDAEARVIFDYNDGTNTTDSVINATAGEEVSTCFTSFPADPARQGYTFVGWADAFGNVYNDISGITGENPYKQALQKALESSKLAAGVTTYVATWAPNIYKIQYVQDTGGTQVMATLPEDGSAAGSAYIYADASSAEIELWTPSFGEGGASKPEGYVFAGWHVGKCGESASALEYKDYNAGDKTDLADLVKLAAAADGRADIDGATNTNAGLIKVVARWTPVYNVAVPIAPTDNIHLELMTDEFESSAASYAIESKTPCKIDLHATSSAELKEGASGTYVLEDVLTRAKKEGTKDLVDYWNLHTYDYALQHDIWFKLKKTSSAPAESGAAERSSNEVLLPLSSGEISVGSVPANESFNFDMSLCYSASGYFKAEPNEVEQRIATITWIAATSTSADGTVGGGQDNTKSYLLTFTS
ncbi:InlB B-repeat-containing protein [Adlercreutzia sp. ZJ154]|uniref:InlB B-repeat-containing protein n=1 Tax=Adlercreutzia sp. ZJ154 TaxID=2709790 RepID=UPI0013EC0904|nr:InlB B-repeat-containing protein [Adlercreutzia sp. ZJ154]